MADEQGNNDSGGGISWGKWLLGGAVIVGAALVAPVVLQNVSSWALSSLPGAVGSAAASPDSVAGIVGKYTGDAAHFLSSNYASIGDKIGLNVIENNFKSFSGLGGVLGQVGDKAMTTIQQNPLGTSVVAAGTLGAGLVLGQHTAAVVERRAQTGAPVRSA